MKHPVFLFYLFLAIQLTGCVGNPGTEEELLMVPESDSLALSLEEKYEIDTLKSFFSWKDPAGHNGIIPVSGGFLTIRDSVVSQGVVFLDMKNIDILDLRDFPEQLKEYKNQLRSVQIYNTKNFPLAILEFSLIEDQNVASLEPTNFDEFSDIETTHSIQGRLTLKGISNTLNFFARIDSRNNKLESSAQFTLNPSLFDLNFTPTSSAPYPGRSEKLEMSFDIITHRKTNNHH